MKHTGKKTGFRLESFKEIDHLQDLVVDGWVTLQRNLKKYERELRLDVSGSG